ncbi:MAG: glycosyltransferase family 2 protein [Dyella sp.]
MIGVIIPAHNEEALIGRCLASVQAAAQWPALHGEEVRIFVALDRCSDGTAGIVHEMGATPVEVRHANVGHARASAAAAAVAAGARWLACTDADSRVPCDWLSAQTSTGYDAFCGVIDVDDWEDYDASVARAFRGAGAPVDGHPHVHGANLGISTPWYARCGGFQRLPAHEDVAIVQALHALGATIARHARPVVLTSARRIARAPAGFSRYLGQLEAQVSQGT